VSPCWLVPCWRLHADVVQRHGKSQSDDEAIDAAVLLSSEVAFLQFLDLLQGTTDTELQIFNTRLLCKLLATMTTYRGI